GRWKSAGGWSDGRHRHLRPHGANDFRCQPAPGIFHRGKFSARLGVSAPGAAWTHYEIESPAAGKNSGRPRAEGWRILDTFHQRCAWKMADADDFGPSGVRFRAECFRAPRTGTF